MLALVIAIACGPGPDPSSWPPAASPAAGPSSWPPAASPAAEPVDAFSSWLDLPGPVADGFSSPVGRGWKRCGDGCWSRAAPEDVLAIADGVVTSAGDVVRVRHSWYEDEAPTTSESAWTGLSGAPAVGTVVHRGDVLGRATAFQLHLDGVGDVRGFLSSHGTLVVPQREPVLALISHDARELRVYRDGVEAARFPVAFGQQPGAKERRGDDRTPKGLYYVVERSRGPFAGQWADWYGGLWLRLDYPNPWDARRGVDEGLITASQADAIAAAWARRERTDEKTALGGGIGIHAWVGPWDPDGERRLSWGCVVVEPEDADAVDAAVPVGTLVALF